MVKTNAFALRNWLFKRDFRIVKLSSSYVRACLKEGDTYLSIDFMETGSYTDFNMSRSLLKNNVRKKTKDIGLHGYSLDYIKKVITNELRNEV